MYKFYPKNVTQPPGRVNKFLLIMKLITLILITAIVQVSASSHAQRITLTAKNLPLIKVFDQIRVQTGYDFLFTSSTLKDSAPVNVNVKNIELNDALEQIFKTQPLEFKIENKSVIVSKKELSLFEKVTKILTLPIQINGIVVGENGPLSGVTIINSRTGKGTITNLKGEFVFSDINDNDVLTFNYIGYEKYEFTVKEKATSNIIVTMKLSTSKLDEVQVVAYGQKTSQRISTGAIAKVTAEDIAKQPVTNVLQALSGQVPGLFISQNSGTPGAGISVQIRAAKSLPSVLDGDNNPVPATGVAPLYIVDGVPFISEPIYAAGGNNVGYLKPSFGNNPLNIINPSDIESIQILKDADATSIYGSRGGNGVILITTKKGKSGKTQLNVNFSNGISDVANLHKVENMTLSQYLEVRRRAFANSGATPRANNAPDLMVWDTNNSTDFQKLLMGKTAHATDASASFSGGNSQTNFLLSGTYHNETTVIPGDYTYKRGSVHLAVEHSSPDRKFTANITATLSLDQNNNVARSGNTTDLGAVAFSQAPNFPLYNASGTGLYWFDLNTFSLQYENPLKYMYQKYSAKNNNLIGGIMLKYTPVKDLNIKLNTSYNKLVANAQDLAYSQSINPLSGTLPSSKRQQNNVDTWNVEPQIDYTLKISRGSLNLLSGATFQDNKYDQPIYVVGTNYSSDALLGSISGAGSVNVYNFNSEYKYQSFFARANYNWLNKYILNVNYRRDGSSRFGANKRFGNFGSVGSAWIFTEEDIFKNTLPALSYGKLRGSYGSTGNDQIPDYLYLDSYKTTLYGYNGTTGLAPNSLANPDLQWEVNKKLEFALDLGFLKDRILLTGAWFRNKVNNSLVSVPQSTVTGFNSYYGNLPATIQKKGFEFTLTTQNLKSKNFNWTTNFNISFVQSKLLSFPGIENTQYSSSLVVGNSLSTIYAYRYTGLSPVTNLPTIEDANKSGSTDITMSSETGLAAYGLGDKVAVGKTDPDFYGGMINTFRYKNFQLDLMLQFTGRNTQYGIDYYAGSAPPGYNVVNMSSYMYDLFKQTNGKIATRTFGINTDGTAYNTYSKYIQSDAVLSNAAYLRLKNVSFSYTFKDSWVKSLKMSSARFYLQGQNLLTFTKFKGYDPETLASNIPPLRTIVAGVNFSF
ncbi:SusC/RagA family TonB-linked outer membrane protein [Pedobacter sp. MR2016-19]|uniref:SusC/RagA family TonB-linked outer membrane protein n=1 Tax=Pedobacter sp. MR2016-19 TaxID=2780089 RepID=UPI00187739F1|nr:SusC/RagA family TonB-linked outer membrane protein [Pedobacter sp. MR2016-19]MBE5321181.1 SusC/RagA family TonB-linked outer membrane protein [Pedobacter sp. MR2016-19]